MLLESVWLYCLIGEIFLLLLLNDLFDLEGDIPLFDAYSNSNIDLQLGSLFNLAKLVSLFNLLRLLSLLSLLRLLSLFN